jgi:hypothetical protein
MHLSFHNRCVFHGDRRVDDGLQSPGDTRCRDGGESLAAREFERAPEILVGVVGIDEVEDVRGFGAVRPPRPKRRDDDGEVGRLLFVRLAGQEQVLELDPSGRAALVAVPNTALDLLGDERRRVLDGVGLGNGTKRQRSGGP